MKMYVPEEGADFTYPLLGLALTRPIRWDFITQNYDFMMKYATAIRLRTASTDAVLCRFASETTHPAYAAMLKVGRTIFPRPLAPRPRSPARKGRACTSSSPPPT